MTVDPKPMIYFCGEASWDKSLVSKMLSGVVALDKRFRCNVVTEVM